MILKALEVGYLGTDCYVVGSETTGEGMVIDPAGEENRILQAVKDAKLDIKLIVLTHGHPDHIAALGEVKKATGARVAIHPDDAPALNSAETRSFSAMFGIAFNEPPEPDWLLKEGDVIKLGELEFKVMQTPGHSPGCICLEGEGVVFSGDTLFNYGVGRTDLPGGNYKKLMASLNDKLMKLPDETLVYPGHGPHSTIGAERKNNPFLRGDFI
ncbi:MBL fold metallo-hydrolase [Chloroflexota bacterium]